MRERVLKILEDIDEEIITYEGDSLFDDGLLDSLTVIDIVAEFCEEFDISISAKYIVEENFKTVDDMVRMIEELAG